MKRMGLFVCLYFFLFITFSCILINGAEDEMYGSSEPEFLSDELEMLRLQKIANQLTSEITDAYIEAGKITVESVTTQIDEDDTVYKNYAGVKFLSDEAFEEYIRETEPIIRQSLGPVFSHIVFSRVPSAKSRDLSLSLYSVTEKNVTTVNAGTVTIKLSIQFSVLLWHSWHNWKIEYTDSDNTTKAPVLQLELIAAKNQSASNFSAHQLKDTLGASDNTEVWVYTEENPSTVIKYTEGIADDWMSYTWWRDSAKCAIKLSLYNADYVEEKLWYQRHQGASEFNNALLIQ